MQNHPAVVRGGFFSVLMFSSQLTVVCLQRSPWAIYNAYEIVKNFKTLISEQGRKEGRKGYLEKKKRMWDDRTVIT